MTRKRGRNLTLQARPESAEPELVYPEEDGEPMGVTPVHRDEMIRLIKTLQHYYAHRSDVYVSGDMMVYEREGDPTSMLSPDVMVVFGVEKLPGGQERRVFVIPLEGAVPAMVIELTSRSTVDQDLRRKRGLYARLGIAEYFLYDPLAEYLAPPLQGLRLEGDGYLEMAPDVDGALVSAALGLRLVLVNGRLRFFDPRTDAMLLDAEERADAAEARVAELEAELRRLRGELPESLN